MDTIMSYLDNMFMNFPKTPEVIRAKEDLAEMMEDKYNELIAEGRMENEAIGIVISEFGNIQELAEELGIATDRGQFDADSGYHKEDEQQNDKQHTGKSKHLKFDGTLASVFGEKDDHLIHLSNLEVEEYLFAVKQSSVKIAAGTALCICSPALLILFSGMRNHISEGVASGAGVSALLLMAACAVGLFISAGMKLEQYEYLKKKCFTIDEETEQMLINRREARKGVFVVKIAAGAAMCILSVIPMIISVVIADHSQNEFAFSIATVLLLLIIGGAVSLFITAGMNEEALKIILQEKEYSVKRKSGSKFLNVVESFYWPIVVVIYLAWSFMSNQWGITWIIWPLAGAVHNYLYENIF